MGFAVQTVDRNSNSRLAVDVEMKTTEQLMDVNLNEPVVVPIWFALCSGFQKQLKFVLGKFKTEIWYESVTSGLPLLEYEFLLNFESNQFSGPKWVDSKNNFIIVTRDSVLGY